MPDAADRLTVGIDQIACAVQAAVRNGVIMCPSCGDELVEVGRDDDGINYECRSAKTLWDSIRRDLVGAIDRG